MEERIQAAVDEALESGPQGRERSWSPVDQGPDRGGISSRLCYYVSKYCEPYLKKYYPRWRRSHVTRNATYTYLRKRTMGRKATPADMADFASERELVGATSLMCGEFRSWALERGILPPSYKDGAITAFFRECGYQVQDGALNIQSSSPLRNPSLPVSSWRSST